MIPSGLGRQCRRRLAVIAHELLEEMQREGGLSVGQALRRLQAYQAMEPGDATIPDDVALRRDLQQRARLVPDRPEWTPDQVPSERDIIHDSLGIPRPRRLTPRHATVSIIGVANAGKSTLMNLLINNKVSAVSQKRNTTRANTLGIYSKGLTQLVFVDTPGIVSRTETKTLQREMATDAWMSIQESDIGLLVVDAARSFTQTDEFIIKELASMDRRRDFRLSLILNKIDLIHPKRRLLPIAAALNQALPFDRTFMVSAEKDDGVNDIKRYLIENCNEGAWPFDSDTVTNLSLGDRISEIIREALFQRLNQELPYKISLRHQGLRRNVDGSVRIELLIITETSRHKQMVVGRGGDVLEWVRKRTRRHLSSLLGGAEIDLRLEVLVQKKSNDAFQP